MYLFIYVQFILGVYIKLVMYNFPKSLIFPYFWFTDFYPPVEKIVEQCGKFRLLDRLLERLLARKHKVWLWLFSSHFFFHFLFNCLLIFHLIWNQVLIFSQWTKVLDIMHYYFVEKGLEVCRIDGSVKLDERRRQVYASLNFMRI